MNTLAGPDVTPTATCRHCGRPIGLIPTAGRLSWVHTGPQGAFPCREPLTGMCLPTQATPATPPTPSGSTHHTPGRYQGRTAPATPVPDRPVRPATTPYPATRQAALQARPHIVSHRRPPARPDTRRPAPGRGTMARLLTTLRLRRRCSRAHSLSRLRVIAAEIQAAHT